MSFRLRVSVPDESWLTAFCDLTNVDVIVWDVEQRQPDGVLDIALLPYGLVVEPLRKFDPTRIKLIQSQALGYDGVQDALPPGATYSNAVGVHERNAAELAVALTLASQRRLDEFARQQTAGEWDRPWGVGLVNRSVVLIGVGGIGHQIYRRLQGFDCDIVRVAGRRRDDDYGTVHGIDELMTLLPRADVVIIAVPLTSSTERLVNDGFLDALADNALVVNISRGSIIDTEAVLRQAGRIRYTTDVVDVEPVPPDHPLRRAPGVFVTPHVGGRSLAQRPRVEQLVRRQIKRLQSGVSPENVVLQT